MWNRCAPVMVRALALLAALAGLLPGMSAAHDIPGDVRIVAYVKPVDGRLQLLVRVPLAAMREVDFPVRGPGYLDLPRLDAALAGAASLWLADNIELYEGDARLAQPKLITARVSLASDKSFTTFESAMAHLQGPRIPHDTDLYWNQQLLDVLFEVPIQSAAAEFAIHPKLARLGQRVMTTLRFLPPGGAERVFELHGDPGLVRLDPRWHQAALRFVESGFLHILAGIDHLLFLLCLVIPFRRMLPLVVIVTSFTVAHSITLVTSAFGYAPGGLWFPPLIETLIALSIVWMALENIAGAASIQRRWVIAFVFGLVHGFGFSFALRESLQFAGSHLVTSLLSFNIGVEIGQLLVLVALVPALNLLFRHAVAERIGTIILSALVAHTGWHWMMERGEDLMKFPRPELDAAAAASLLRWLMAVLVLGGIMWFVSRHLRRWLERQAK
jgi:HupE / UreJ protein